MHNLFRTYIIRPRFPGPLFFALYNILLTRAFTFAIVFSMRIGATESAAPISVAVFGKMYGVVTVYGREVSDLILLFSDKQAAFVATNPTDSIYSEGTCF